MNISTNMFCSPLISQHKKERYLKKIHKKKNIKNILLLIYRTNTDNLLEIMKTNELYRLAEREDDLFVVGMTENMEEAYEWISHVMINTNEHFTAINKQTLFKELEGNA